MFLRFPHVLSLVGISPGARRWRWAGRSCLTEGIEGTFQAGIHSLSAQLVLSYANSTAKASHCAQAGKAFPQSGLQRLAGPNYSSHHECLSLSHLTHADTQTLLI